MIDGYDDNFSTTDRPIYVKPASINPPNIYIKGKWLDEKKDQYTNVFIDDKPLIRCKDCKYWNRLKTVEMCARTMPAMRMTEDDFCSRGEKRGEEMRLIDADKLKEDVLSWENCYNGYSDVYDKARIVDAIDEMPTVDTERHGHWIEKILCDDGNKLYHIECECSECHVSIIYNPSYCPYCGAKMDEVEE